MKNELYRIWISKKSKNITLLIFFIPMIDLIINAYFNFHDFIFNSEYYNNKIPWSMVLHPVKATFLAGSSMGHLPQMLLVWLLPILLFLLHSDSYVEDKKNGYTNIIFTKMSKKNFLINKLTSVFIVSSCVVLVSLVINLIMAVIIFSKGLSFSGIEEFAKESGGILKYSIENPYIAIIIYIIVFSLMAGALAVICSSLSFIFADYKILYPSVFVVWIILISNKYSITYLIQPFIEYGFNYILVAGLMYLLFFVVTVSITSIIVVKKDEF